MNTEFFLCFVYQIERIFAFTVHLVHENHDRRLTHPADLHESASLRLDTFSRVDDDDG